MDTARNQHDSELVNLHLSRKEHDALMDRDPGLLAFLFAHHEARWGSYGPSFYGLTVGTAQAVQS